MVTGALGKYGLEAELPIVVALPGGAVGPVREQGGGGRRAAVAVLRLRGGIIEPSLQILARKFNRASWVFCS